MANHMLSVSKCNICSTQVRTSFTRNFYAIDFGVCVVEGMFALVSTLYWSPSVRYVAVSSWDPFHIVCYGENIISSVVTVLSSSVRNSAWRF